MIKLSKSSLNEKEKQCVIEVLDQGYLGMGSRVKEFEDGLANYFGREAVCVVNGTAAIQLALQAIGIKPQDEVLLPSLTYVATFQAVSACGAKPIACDVDEATLCLSALSVEKNITEKSRAIIPVHYAGNSCAMNDFQHLASKYNLRLIEDAAHAFGSSYCGEKIGSFGDITCFSFDGIKNITSGEGGCIVSSDQMVLSAVRDARLLGVNNDTVARFSGQRSWDFDVTNQGWRYHMSDIMAAIGCAQLQKFSTNAKLRVSHAKRYSDHFRDHPEIVPLHMDFDEIIPHIYVVKIPNLLKRDELREELLSFGVETGVHYKPNHKLTFYNGSASDNLKNTEQVYPRLLTLPLHPDLSATDIDFISNLLKSTVNKYI